MKIMFYSIVTLLATSMLAFAQSQTPGSVTVTTIAVPSTNIAPQAPAAAPAPAPAPAVPAAELVKQPTTVVEAAPLTTSHADELRKSREATEVETEQKIVEKLEQSRINDEKHRQEKVLNSMEEKKKEEVVIIAPAPAPVPAPIQVAPPATPAVEAAPVVTAAPVAPAPAPIAVTPAPAPALDPSQEVTASAADVTPKEESLDGRYFTSLSAGMMSQSNSPDIKNFGDFMLGVGKNMQNFSLAGEFGYNNMNQNLSWDGSYYRTVSQYTLGVDGRFVLPLGKFRPNIGGVIDYVRRSYGGVSDIYGLQTNYYSTNSNALDYGIVAGAEYQMSPHMSLGIDYRYMMNLTYEYDNNQAIYNTANAYNLSPLESRNYQTWSAVLKYTY